MNVLTMPRSAHQRRRASWRVALTGLLSPDDRRIRRAHAQRESITRDRPTVTVVRGPLPDFMRDLTRVS